MRGEGSEERVAHFISIYFFKWSETELSANCIILVNMFVLKNKDEYVEVES